MKSHVTRRRLKDEAGFTLPEMMVTMVIMITVLFALYSIFDMSIRVFSFGNNKVEAVQNARLGLEKMARELRVAYPVDNTDGTDADLRPDASHLFFDPSNPMAPSVPVSSFDQISFGNDLNGDRKITCAVSACEYITYKLSPDPVDPDAPRTLQRVNSSNAGDAGEAVVEYVKPDDPGTTAVDEGLRITPLKTSLDPSDPATSESQVRALRIELSIRVKGGVQDGTQTLTTNVSLRNRGN